MDVRDACDYVFVLCKYGSDSLVIRLLRSSSFDGLLRYVTGNWSSLDPQNCGFSYSVPGHQRCFLRNDSELADMFGLVDAFELKFIDVNVVDGNRGGTPPGLVSLLGDDRSSSGDVGVIGVPSGPDIIDPVASMDEQAIVPQGSSNKEVCLLSSQWSNAISHVGQVFFGGVSEFRSALCRYSVELGFKFVYIKNNRSKVKAVCAEKFERGCGWFVCASFSKVNGSFFIKRMCGDHSCGMLFMDSAVKRLSYNEIAGLIVDNLRVNSGLRSKDVVGMFRSNYGFDLPYKKAWKALDKAKGMIYGDSTESFKLLKWYSDVAMEKNPGSHIVLDVVSASRRFRRLFVSFYASISGFNHCRPLLFVDGTFLKGKYKGVLLSATGKDGNQGMLVCSLCMC